MGIRNSLSNNDLITEKYTSEVYETIRQFLDNIELVTRLDNSFIVFFETYQGSYTEEPTTRRDGSALQVGDIYVSETTNDIYSYTGEVWVKNEFVNLTKDIYEDIQDILVQVTQLKEATEASELSSEGFKDAASISATNAATSATNASSSASTANTQRIAAQTAKTDSEAARDAAEGFRNQASTFASNASNSASTASTGATTATTKASEALGYRNKAEEWAEKGLNVPVETGKYSAKHWALTVENALSTKVDKVSGKGLSTNDLTNALLDKLNVIEAEATKNATDVELRDRVTHTGEQAISTVTGLQEALDNKVDKVTGKQLSTEDYTTTEKSKLSGIAEGATTNSTDAQLRDRSTHTGTQAVSTITGLGDLATQDMDDIRDVYDVEPRTSVQPTISSDFTRNDHKLYEQYGLEPKTITQMYDVVRASTATYVDATGKIRTAGVNQPRIDFSSGQGRLLVEEARTNLLTWSEDFSNDDWSKPRLTVTSSSVVAPDGSLAAYKIIETTENNWRAVVQNLMVPETTYTASLFVKPAERNIVVFGDNGNSRCVGFNVSAKTVVVVRNPTNSIISYEIIPLEDGWVRLVVTFKAEGIGVCWFLNDGSLASNLAYQGDGASGLYIWGAQLEQG